ncbi:hypothetical protein E2562_004686 [Oryza meyeriana var. granulata]|uniref:Uncharacterized protein n=1 Tax=Oryza meyeriana var. granulata TaxID=110450 RepID=A0A6G1DEV1_9ORYZ|nr:hypothetical protein E2562_004686 [Oryza meyeriana var. granulata]
MEMRRPSSPICHHKIWKVLDIGTKKLTRNTATEMERKTAMSLTVDFSSLNSIAVYASIFLAAGFSRSLLS